MERVKLVWGDWSKDGHEKTDNEIVLIEGGKEDFKYCFAEAQRITGVKAFRWAEDYDDKTLSYSDVIKAFGSDALKEGAPNRGFSATLYEREGVADWGIYIEDYPLLILEFAKVGGLKYERIKEDKMQTVEIGGYGMFT